MALQQRTSKRISNGPLTRRKGKISLRKILCIISFCLFGESIWTFFLVIPTITKVERAKSPDHYLSLFRQGRVQNTIKNTGNEKGKKLSSKQENNMVVEKLLLEEINRKSPPLTAFVESPAKDESDDGILSLRTSTELKAYTYHGGVAACDSLPDALPVDHDFSSFPSFGPNVGNDMKSLYSVRSEYASCCCPVDADPFLPWIHDLFPNNDATFIEFVAHNKRRCRTDPQKFNHDLTNLEPQVTIMQGIPIKRLSESNVRQIAPKELWQELEQDPSTTNDAPHESKKREQRYRLATSFQDADSDARETRFICQYHTMTQADAPNRTLQKIVLGETLSTFPYNYEHANFRKPNSHPMLTRPSKSSDGKESVHNEQIWNSVFHFRCPIPEELQSTIKSGESIVDGTPGFFLDLVPIRTRPRLTREGYFPQSNVSSFDPIKEWGEAHVLPLVEKSGRWANLPICRTPLHEQQRLQQKDSSLTANRDEAARKEPTHRDNIRQKHFLTGCLWASASYTTRGGGVKDTSTSLRLLEWITYHLYIAKFDHIYVYDNTAAHSKLDSLAPIIDLFPKDQVTRIPWKHKVCNNNRPNHPNAGERSSQYVAEADCRIRYGSNTEWMASFDTDEYLIPQGNWTDLKHWLQHGQISHDTHILSFHQTRALPNVEFMEAYYGDKNNRACGDNRRDAKCLAKRANASFLEAYDCEFTTLPKPEWGWRAKKQIFKPWFVLNHFVHYTTVTKRIHDAPNEVSPPFKQRAPYERRVDELAEAFMLHTKTTSPEATKGWKEKCHNNFQAKRPEGDRSCPVGIAWPLTKENQSNQKEVNSDLMVYNCFRHPRALEAAEKLKQLLIPLLQSYNLNKQ